RPGGQQVRHRLGQPDPQLRPRSEPHQGPAHRHRAQRYPEGARRRPGRVHRSQPQGRPGRRRQARRRLSSPPSRRPREPAMTDTPATPPAADENLLIAERRSKLAALRQQGVAFPNDFRRCDYAGDLQAEYADAERWDAAALEAAQRKVVVAGRLMAKRVMGKATFAHIQDMSGRLQVFLQANVLGEAYEAFKSWDIGDIVGVTGGMTRTRTGELS